MAEEYEDVIKMVFEINRESCRCGIPEFYNNIMEEIDRLADLFPNNFNMQVIAEDLREKDPEEIHFDCRRIRVTPDVQDEVFEYYRENENASDEDLGMLWCLCGPKADIRDIRGPFVCVERGFIC